MLFIRTGISVYRLVAAKHAIRLEQAGLKFSKGRSWSTVMRREFGLSPRCSREIIIRAIDRKLEEIVPIAQAEGGITE